MGVSEPLRLDVSIGPVQGFVAQSRRTRDLWGSSYLLSYLSANAALAVEEAGGKVVQPQLGRDELFRWLKGQAEPGGGADSPPHTGSVPNHFVAEVGGVEEGRRAAEAAVAGLERAWRKVCQAVWDRYVAPAEGLGLDVAAIWHRQTGQYWEVIWTLSPMHDGGAALARRKLWRTHRLPDEPGDKCMVMPDLQELSGYVRSRGEAAAQDRFWEAVRREAGLSNLPPGDRLCAIALVKRLFVDVSEQAIGGRIDAANWPSNVSIAAVPWIGRVLEAAPGKAREYARAVSHVAPGWAFSERLPIDVGGKDTGGFERLNGDYFHKDWVLDDKECVLPGDGPGIRKKLAEMLEAIAEVRDSHQRPVGYPADFYALLMADGDRLGELLQVYKPEGVSGALAAFARDVPRIVRDQLGVVVYAGGDDLLAMLPVTTALDCARALAEAYRAAFGGVGEAMAAPGGGGLEPTMSASVLFTHTKVALNTALRELRRLLDDVAKDGNGRDSLAVGILKRGGINAQWVTTWRRRQLSQPGEVDAVEAITGLAAHLDRYAGERLSSSVLYRVRTLLSMLCQGSRWSPGSWGVLPKGVDLPAFVRAEVVNSLSHAGVQNRELEVRAETLVQAMLDVLARSPRQESGSGRSGGRDGTGAPGGSAAGTGGSGYGEADGTEVGVDGLLVARFLAGRGEEGGDS